MYKIIDREEDIANKWRVRVDINGETITFKFHQDPKKEEIELEVIQYLRIMQELQNPYYIEELTSVSTE